MAIQYAGGTNVNATFTPTLKSDIMSNLKTQLVTAGMSLAALLAGQGPGNVGTVTITIAAPGVVTFTSHGFLGGEKIMFRTTGALPTGITAGTVYFVKFIDANTFNFAATLGGANITTSGSQSGVHTLNTESILVTTATTPQGYALNIRFKDNGGTCVQVSIESTDGVKVGNNSTTAGGSLIPSGVKTFRIIANKYQVACIYTGDFNTPREFVFCCVPYLWSFLTPTSYIGFMVNNSLSDTDTTASRVIGNWRYSVQDGASNNHNNHQLLYGSNMWENDNAANGSTGNWRGAPHLIRPVVVQDQQVHRYGNSDDLTFDPLITWGTTGPSDEPMVRGQIWDGVLLTDQFTGDTTATFDTHNWICVTSSVTSGVNCALWLVVP